MKPMLAHSYEKHRAKVKWPAYVQPKLDGMRCIAHIVDGKVVLRTRTDKPITSVPHIVEALEREYSGRTLILDGELYNHELRDNFEKIISLCRKKTPVPEAEMVQYHIYDAVEDDVYEQRMTYHKHRGSLTTEVLTRVTYWTVPSEQAMFSLYLDYVAEGYEGCMIRDTTTAYENKRSYSLLKYKGELHENSGWEEQEFEIESIKEGEGKLLGCVGAFNCRTAEGVSFSVKLATSETRLRQLYNNPKDWKNKKLTVKFFGRTNKNKVPRFPIGKEIRDYE